MGTVETIFDAGYEQTKFDILVLLMAMNYPDPVWTLIRLQESPLGKLVFDE